MKLGLTLCLNPLSVSHQTVLKVGSSADDGVTADHTALDVTSGNNTHKHQSIHNVIIYDINVLNRNHGFPNSTQGRGPSVPGGDSDSGLSTLDRIQTGGHCLPVL